MTLLRFHQILFLVALSLAQGELLVCGAETLRRAASRNSSASSARWKKKNAASNRCGAESVRSLRNWRRWKKACSREPRACRQSYAAS